MARRNKGAPAARPRRQWYISGAVVLVGALVLFAYITFIQASVAFSEASMSIEVFQSLLIERLIKGLTIVLTLGLFLFFFAVQDYRLTFNNLLERLTFVQSTLMEEDAASEGSASPTTSTLRATFKDDLSLIEYSVDTMLNKNLDYQNRLDSQRDDLRKDFLLRLMKGWVKDTSVTRRMCSSFGFGLLESDYLVMVTGIPLKLAGNRLQEETVTLAYFQMHQILTQMLRNFGDVFAISVDDRLAMLILPAPTENLRSKQTVNDLTRAIKLSHQMVFDESRIVMQSALGSVERGVSGIHQSYSKATDTFEFAQLIGKGSAVTTSHEGVETEEDERLSSSWSAKERQFSNCVEAGEYQYVSELFQEMLDCGYISNAPTLELAQYRMLNLTDLLVQSIESAGAAVGWEESELVAAKKKVVESNSLDKLRGTSAEVFSKLTLQSMAKQRQTSYIRIMDIIDHIEENYSDMNLCVNQIADSFALNPSYLSRSFKKLMNIGLADYIRIARVKKAKELLNDNSNSVKEVADLVGFGNVLTMNRAFRKQEGTTAGRLRKTSPEID